jgi:parvulin-like peptidyl-prolyl isomerase
MRSLRLTVPRPLPALLAVLTVVLFVAAGCGGKGKDQSPKTVLAKVGDKEITAAYYEKKLGRLHPVDLPRDDDGNVLDTAEMAGKRRFLDTIINKDVMVTIAAQLGFNDDAQIDYARTALIANEAVTTARRTLVDEPASKFTEDDVLAFYEKFGTVRHCRYFIANTREDALRGRESALAGTDWLDLWNEFHAGPREGTVSHEIDLHYGRFITSFEDPIFAAKVGDITEPVFSTYGWWVVKIDGESQAERPPLKEIRPRIEASIVSRNQMRLVDEYRAGLQKKYQQYINEDALVKAYAGLPADEGMFYPGTKDPIKREDLKPLELDPSDSELDFYGYTVKGEPRKYTLGDFKAAYDRMSVFERPKRAEMVGGLRNKIGDEIGRALLNFDAQDRRLDKDPEVLARVAERIDEMLVGKLFEEGVHYDQTVSPAALDSAWALLKDQYDLPETRSGKRILVTDQAQAEKAHAELEAGESWRRVLNKYGSDETDKAIGGRLGPIRADAQGPERDALFSLEVGRYSTPRRLDDGRYSIVMLDEIAPPRGQELTAVADAIVKRIQNKREEMAFRAALDGWKQKVKIQVFEDRLAKTRSWEELVDAAKQVKKPAGA